MPEAVSLRCGSAVAMFMHAFAFTTMTSVTPLTFPPAFNYGPNELGAFLAAGGLIAVLVAVCAVKPTIARLGPVRHSAICDGTEQ